MTAKAMIQGSLLLMVQKSQRTTWNAKNPANNEMNYLSSGVDGFFSSSVSTNQDFTEYHKGFESTVHMFFLQVFSRNKCA